MVLVVKEAPINARYVMINETSFIYAPILTAINRIIIMEFLIFFISLISLINKPFIMQHLESSL